MRIEKRVRKILKVDPAYGKVSPAEISVAVQEWLEDIETGHLQNDESQDYMIANMEDLIKRMRKSGFTDKGLARQRGEVIRQMEIAQDWIGSGQGGAGKAQDALLHVLDITGRGW